MCPEDYEQILASLRKQHPKWPESKLKTVAAKITNSNRKASGRPPAKFHRK